MNACTVKKKVFFLSIFFNSHLKVTLMWNDFFLILKKKQKNPEKFSFVLVNNVNEGGGTLEVWLPVLRLKKKNAFLLSVLNNYISWSTKFADYINYVKRKERSIEDLTCSLSNFQNLIISQTLLLLYYY